MNRCSVFNSNLLVGLCLVIIVGLVSQEVWGGSKLPLNSFVKFNANHKVLFKKVKAGDTLYTIAKREGFTRKHWVQIVRSGLLKKSFVLSQGLRYKVGWGKNRGERELKFYYPTDQNALYLWKSKDKAGAEIAPANYTKKVKHIEGQVRGSLVQSIMNKVDDVQLAYRFMNAFKLDTRIRALQRGAFYSLKFEDLYDGKMRIRSGEVLEASLEDRGKLKERFFVHTEEGGAFIDLQKNQDKIALYAPVAYLKITSMFQRRRFHPIKKRYIAHLGIDFELPLGSPILSAEDGTIEKIGRSRGAGKYVVIKHENGLTTYYNHLHTHESDLEVGDEVLAGEPIGTIGCTGYCTKPHLHFAVKRGKKFLDPAPLIRSYSAIQAPVVESLRTQLLRDFSEVKETTL